MKKNFIFDEIWPKILSYSTKTLPDFRAALKTPKNLNIIGISSCIRKNYKNEENLAKDHVLRT